MEPVIQAGIQMMGSHKRKYRFTIDKNGYTGDFTAKYPSLMDRMNAGLIKAKFLGDMGGKVDIITDNIAYMAAVLQTQLTEKPNWFDLSKSRRL